MIVRVAQAIVIVLLSAFSGCGSNRPETAKVTGRITLDGIPVKTGTVIFYPETGRCAVGDIQSDGTYNLKTFEKEDGAIVGNHVVTIEATEIVGGKAPQSFEEESKGLHPGELRTIIPAVYNDRLTSGLQAAVEAKENKIDFDLKKTKGQ